jgi:1-acyl-sn-glycerol-3-phosphate acyltransferase
MWYRLLRSLLRLFARVWCRLEVTGLEHFPATGPVIVASNHLSFIDSVLIPVVAPRRVRFLAKEEYFTGTGVRGRASALFFRFIGAVPVSRDGSRDALAALSLAQRVLEDGEAFGILVDPVPLAAKLATGDLGPGRARRELTDEVMAAIAAMSPQEHADGYNDVTSAGDISA